MILFYGFPWTKSWKRAAKEMRRLAQDWKSRFQMIDEMAASINAWSHAWKKAAKNYRERAATRLVVIDRLNDEVIALRRELAKRVTTTPTPDGVIVVVEKILDGDTNEEIAQGVLTPEDVQRVRWVVEAVQQFW